MTTEDKLQHWIAEEEKALARLDSGAGPGVAAPTEISQLPGIGIMQDMMGGRLPYAECAKSMNFCAIEVGPGYAIFQGSTTRGQLNPMGTIQGGWIGSVLDSALGSAVLTTLTAGQLYTTTSLEVKYQKYLTLKTSRVRAEARVLHSEGRNIFAEASLFGPDGTVYANATTTCRLIGNPSDPARQ